MEFIDKKNQNKILRCLSSSFFDRFNSSRYHQNHRRIFLTLAIRLCRPSLPVGLQVYVLSPYYCRLVLVDRLTLARPCEGVHRRRLLMSSFLLFQQCPACLVRLIWMVLEMGVRWPCSCCFVECCFQNLFNIARILLLHSRQAFCLYA